MAGARRASARTGVAAGGRTRQHSGHDHARRAATGRVRDRERPRPVRPAWRRRRTARRTRCPHDAVRDAGGGTAARRCCRRHRRGRQRIMSAISVEAEPAGTKSLWRDRRFAAFWTSFTVSQVGDRVTELALPLIAVVLLDATPSQVGLLTAAVWLPNLIAMFVGTWIDRRAHKRRVLVVADLFRAAALLAVPIAYSLDALTLGVLYAVALATGMGEVMFHMAYPAFYVRLVPRESYVDANSKLSASRAGAFVAGPAVAGALIHAVTAPVAIIVDAISFVFSAGVIGRLRGLAAEATPAPSDPEEESLVRQALDGIRFVARHSV